jgi:hypothetical protein
LTVQADFCRNIGLGGNSGLANFAIKIVEIKLYKALSLRLEYEKEICHEILFDSWRDINMFGWLRR